MNWINYLIQSNLFLALFYGLYWSFLRKETFNMNNRIYLVGSAFLSLAIPFWNSEIVQSWFITRQANTLIYSYEFSEVLISNQASQEQGLSLTQAMTMTYSLGVGVLLIKFLVSLFKLGSLLKAENPAIKAFSFFNRVFVDSSLNGKDAILEHEHVHARQVHSFDIVFFEVLSIVCWFNPVIWFYRISIRNIHEFIADEIASRQLPSKADYAVLLFSEQFQTRPGYLVNPFFDRPTLKLRITMLKKERSTKTALLKYGLIVPLFISMLILTSATISSDAGSEKLHEMVNALEDYRGNKTISGTITDARTKKTLAGVSIHVHAGNRGTFSDTKGNFMLQQVHENTLLSISAEGYQSQTVWVNAQKPVVVALSPGPELRFIPSSTDQLSQASVQPEFPGGKNELLKYIRTHLRYPETALKAQVSGKVFLKFLIEEDGSIGEIKVLKGVGFGCDEEAVRVVSAMPKWQSGRRNGKPVSVYFSLPVSFQLAPVIDKGVLESETSTLLLTEPAEVVKGYHRLLDSGYEVPFSNLKQEQKHVALADTKPGSAVSSKSTGSTAKAANLFPPISLKNYGASRKYPEQKPAYPTGHTSKVNKGTITFGVANTDPVVFINEKEERLEKLNQMNTETIESVNVLKGAEAVKKHGEKAINGAIEILLKKSVP